MNENKKLEFRGGSFMALIPFAIFIVITIGLSFANAADLNMMIGAGVVGLLVGMLFVKDLEAYWDTILAGLGSKVGMTAVMLWLVVGIYGNILKSGHIVEGLVWLGVQLNMSGAAFTVAAFVFAALFAMATGSGFGTISTMSFILYPAGILLGSNPAVLAGAILSGAAVGSYRHNALPAEIVYPPGSDLLIGSIALVDHDDPGLACGKDIYIGVSA